jgi:hypothetical protein
VTTRRSVAAAALGASVLLAGAPASAPGAEPSRQLVKTYLQAYHRAERAGGEPGRNIARDGVRRHGRERDASARELRRSLRVLRRMAPAAGSIAGGRLDAIAACESGGDPTAVDASGTYRGKYQFDRGTWASVGGSGDPAAAPEAEQDARARALVAQRGTAAWPVCGG